MPARIASSGVMEFLQTVFSARHRRRWRFIMQVVYPAAGKAIVPPRSFGRRRASQEQIMFNGSRCCCILCALVGLALAWLMLASVPVGQAQTPSGPVSFINDVAPILKENCFACHDAKKKKGKFEMTSYENIRKGGTKDDPIVPGKSRESIIIDLLTSTGVTRMPPKELADAL